MNLKLSSLRFNHDSRQNVTSALNVRRNGTVFSSGPEWRSGWRVWPFDSRVVYAIQEVDERSLFVEAEFAWPRESGRPPRSIWVRTNVAPRNLWADALRWLPHPDTLRPVVGPWFSPWTAAQHVQHASYALTYQSAQAAASIRDPVLGGVAPTEIRFDGSSRKAKVRLKLSGVRLKSRGCGVADVGWQWQWRDRPWGSWRHLEYSAHRVYSTLAAPTEPWRSGPHRSDNTALLWTDVLEHACRWASGARSVEQAAGAVTDAVFRLGGPSLEYGCRIGTVATYSDWLYETFDCTGFLERLRGGVGNGRFLNCSDCAAIVSTFSNALGCNLWQSVVQTIDGRFFMTNPILAIGSQRWESPCGWGRGFTYHEVAWQGDCSVDDPIYDACLAVDGGAVPEAQPHFPVVPKNIPYGRIGDGLYRDRFVAVQDREACIPQPQLRKRRRVY